MTRVESSQKDQPLRGVSICFDLDGTLVDTATDLVRVTNEVIATVGLPETDYELARAVVGFGARRLITDALNRAEHVSTEPELDAMQADFLKRYADDIAQKSNPYPGVMDTLSILSEMGAELSVCTNKPSAGLHGHFSKRSA